MTPFEKFYFKDVLITFSPTHILKNFIPYVLFIKRKNVHVKL